MDEQQRLTAQAAHLHYLLKQNAHLMSVLCLIRDAIHPNHAITGQNVDAAVYALGYVFGPLGGEHGRFCPEGQHAWITPIARPPHILAPYCSKCGKLDLENLVGPESPA